LARITAQQYPRIEDQESYYYGCLDDAALVDHINKISPEQMAAFIASSIDYAEAKSSREILYIPADVTDEQLEQIYQHNGHELFKYFVKYCGDPAATAHQLYGHHYKQVGVQQFRLRSVQKERMNSGWRYQFLAFECAQESGRFRNVSDIGAAEADFTAIIDYKEAGITPLSLYVSVKNRTNTMGGQDWPKAIQALEQVAVIDKNRRGSYLCVFGVAMDTSRTSRLIKQNSKTKLPYSVNTEVWYANYFWPFFTNYSYNEIMCLVLDVLLATKPPEIAVEIEVPERLIEHFGYYCNQAGLLDDNGCFNDPHKLVELFCRS
jgi:hypothetical protein